MDDQRRRVVRRHEGDRRDLPGDVPESLIIGDREPEHALLVEFPVVEGGSERRLMIGGVDHLLARLAEVEQVGGREEAGDRLHPARLPVHRVFGIGVTLVARHAEHQRQVPTRRAAVDPDPIRVDAVVLGMMTDEPDGAVHVLDDLGHGEAGLAAVDHGEDGEAPVDERSDEGRVDRLVRGEEAAADDEDDTDALGVRFLGVKTSIVKAVPYFRP